MRNVHNALSDVLEMYTKAHLECIVLDNMTEDNRWVVNVHNKDAPGSLLQFEVINNQGVPVCCVLQNVNIGRKSLYRFMNRLVDALDD
jgi:hypothetical protein